MLHSDNEFLAAYIHAAHDPDPRRAAWYRPFAYPATPVRFEGLPIMIRPRRQPRILPPLARKLAAVAQRLRPVPRSLPVPCCPPAGGAVACC